MTDHDFNRPYIDQATLPRFRAMGRTAQRYGAFVRAAPMSNVDYKLRFHRFGSEKNMMPPPSTGRIFLGYLVIRKIDTPDQYETWMPDHGFEEDYEVPATDQP